MTESEFWLRLERRICHELADHQDRAMRRWWCDGLIPHEYHTEASPPCITGRVWMVDHSDQQLWSFTLLLCRRTVQRDQIEWAGLLPLIDHPGWLAADIEEKRLVITNSVC